MARRLTLREERFAYREPFRIAGHLFTNTSVLVAEIAEGDCVGLGEGAGVYYLGDDLAHMREAAESVRAELEAGARRAELQSLVQDAQRLARRDPLTGLENRLGWDEALAQCEEQVSGGDCASLLVVDINGLKSVNDAYGHEAGDTFLQMGADASCP